MITDPNAPAIDHEAARRAVFCAKLNDEREAKCPVRDTDEMKALRAAFRAASREWDKTANGGKGAWRNPVPILHLARQRVPAIEPNLAGLDRTEHDGKIVSLPDFEDAVDFAIEHAAAVVEAEEIERAAFELFEDRTGELVDEEVYLKMRERNAELLRQSHETAQKLQAVGVDGYSGGDFGMWLFDPVRFHIDPEYGRHAIEQARFRRCNFIPFIAQQKRRFIVKLLEYWLTRHPHARFWTFTSGERCTVEELRDRIQELNRKISRLNAEPFVKDAGVTIVFRATETGSLVDEDGTEKRNAEGKWLYHPHSHCMVEMTKGRLSKRRWRELMLNVWAFMDNQWDDGGQISTVRECAKYPMKPSDVARLSPEETKNLFTALHRLHLVQPLGSLKELKEEILGAGDTLVYKRTKDGPELTRVKNHNRHLTQPAKTDAEKGAEYALSFDDSEREGSPKPIATLAPGAFFDRVMRPAVLVCAKRFGPEEMREICNMPHVRDLIDAALPAYLAAQQLLRSEAAAAAIRVHTYPVTVRTGQLGNHDQREMPSVVAGQMNPEPEAVGG